MLQARHKARAHVLVAWALCAAALLLPANAAGARQDEAPRKPQGPAAGPVIKLPRGAGAEAEQPARAEVERRDSAPIKWEYCAITGFAYKQRGFSLSSPQLPSAVVRFFPSTYEEVEGSNEEEALANAFAKLGDEGWEMSGIRETLKLEDGDGKSAHVYFFKRPKRIE